MRQSRSIWKFPLPIQDESEISVPEGSQFVAVQEQQGELCVWFMVDPNRPTEQRRFRIYGTGYPLDPQHSTYVYRGTVQQLHGRLVWHVFEEES